jgi:hypothetical protein
MVIKIVNMFLLVLWNNLVWRTPKLLNRFKCEYEVRTMEEQKVGACFLVRSTLGVEGRVKAPGWN